jgi:hypothetical protein
MNTKEMYKRLTAQSLLAGLEDKKQSAAYQLRKTRYTVNSKNARDRISENLEGKIELYEALIVVLETEIAAIEALDK